MMIIFTASPAAQALMLLWRWSSKQPAACDESVFASIAKYNKHTVSLGEPNPLPVTHRLKNIP